MVQLRQSVDESTEHDSSVFVPAFECKPIFYGEGAETHLKVKKEGKMRSRREQTDQTTSSTGVVTLALTAQHKLKHVCILYMSHLLAMRLWLLEGANALACVPHVWQFVQIVQFLDNPTRQHLNTSAI